MGKSLRLVLTTCSDRATADRLAEALVSQGLAACVNIVPAVSSIYRYNGKIERDEEVLLMIKTTESQLKPIEVTIKAGSDYELPEVLAVSIVGGSDDYLQWLASSVEEDLN